MVGRGDYTPIHHDNGFYSITIYLGRMLAQLEKAPAFACTASSMFLVRISVQTNQAFPLSEAGGLLVGWSGKEKTVKSPSAGHRN